jgi:hypothetical protein
LSENPAWLNELIPDDGKYYVVYPPMPAVVMIPAAAIFGDNLSQSLFSIFLGSINVCLVYFLGKILQFGQKTSILMALFFGFGTNHWFLANVGSAWYIAHIVALFFLLLALIETFGKGRLWLIGLLIGASFEARTTVIFTTVFFYLYFWRKFWPVNKKSIWNFINLSGGILGFIAIDAIYNFARFGNFSVLSPYQLIPRISGDPIFQEGFMNFHYIPRHFQALFTQLPVFQNAWPYIIPTLYSLPIWLTSPWILLLIKTKRNFLALCSILAIIPTLFIISLWGGVGFAQFGYRFAQDFMPFLLILLGLSIGKKPAWYVYLFLIASILVNFWGVVVINLLGISVI